MVKKQSFKSTISMCHLSGNMAGEGTPGCRAPIDCIWSFILHKSCKRCHFPFFFGITKIGVFHRLTEGLIWPAASCSATNCFVICSHFSAMGHWSTHMGSLVSQVNGGLGDRSPVPMTKNGS